jgi:N-acetylglucosaminyldiphosphoundecaprenol N-acetyl-beta-D-mannosaminyltransferase
MMNPEKVNILGVGVSAVNLQLALDIIEDWITKGERRYVCVRDVHGVVESQRDERLRRIHNAAGLVTPDGMPLVWISKLRGHRHVDRVYGPDLMLALCQRSMKKGYRHYLYGGAEGVPDRLASRLKLQYPGLDVAGTYSPPFRPLTTEEDEGIVQRINASQADVVWIGLSTPKQEKWMADHRDRLEASVLLGVGAAFDFHAGLKRQAPRWIQRSGFEWLFRLLTEPRRLWRRYFVNNPLFLWLILLQGLGIRKYSLEESLPDAP